MADVDLKEEDEGKHDTKPKRRRVKSAVARLSPLPESQSSQVPDELKVIQKEFKQRTTSAQNIRKQHTASRKVIPGGMGPEKKDRFKTMYSADFRGKYVTPPECRPTSPTRRHNPHPSRSFLTWKAPTRVLTSPRTAGFVDGGGFEDDELVGSFERMQLPLPEPSSKDYGQYLRAQRARQQQQQQQQQQQYPGIMGQGLDGRPLSRPVSSEILTRTVQRHSVGAFDDWLIDATPEEQDTVLRMLKSAEEKSMKSAIHKNLQPDAARAVEGWLQNATEEERDVAARLFTNMESRQQSRPSTRTMKRSTSAPAIRPLSALGNEGLQGQAIPAPQYKPGGALWHLKSMRNPPPKVYHGGALFGATRVPTSHYTIHPEWPDYTTPTDPIAQ